jgi:hypothetical protein
MSADGTNGNAGPTAPLSSKAKNGRDLQYFKTRLFRVPQSDTLFRENLTLVGAYTEAS